MKAGFFAAIFTGVLCGLVNQSNAQEPIAHTLDVSGIERHYLEYRPTGLQSGAPLVILLHGGMQGMGKVFRPRRKHNRYWMMLADQEEFLLLTPNGTNPDTGDTATDRQHWNDLRDAAKVGNADIDDVGFIAALIDQAAEKHSINRHRVYVTGASNGGMMTYRLLIERPDLFAAGVAFIANLPKTPVKGAAMPTPIMIVNGTEDRLVPYDGGMIARQRGLVRSTADTITYWVGVNGADPAAMQETILPDLNPDDGCRLIRTVYPAPLDGEPVVVLTMQGGGHKIPSASMPRKSGKPHAIVGRRCHDAEGADLAWSFLSRYSR